MASPASLSRWRQTVSALEQDFSSRTVFKHSNALIQIRTRLFCSDEEISETLSKSLTDAIILDIVSVGVVVVGSCSVVVVGGWNVVVVVEVVVVPDVSVGMAVGVVSSGELGEGVSAASL